MFDLNLIGKFTLIVQCLPFPMCPVQVQISKVCKDTATLRKTQTHGTPWDIVDTMGGGGGRVSHVFSHSAFTLMSVPLPTGPVAE